MSAVERLNMTRTSTNRHNSGSSRTNVRSKERQIKSHSKQRKGGTQFFKTTDLYK